MRKTKKTLSKRIKITKTGKVLKKQNRTGHLKRKMSVNRKHRKTGLVEQSNKGHIKVIKALLGKQGKNI